MKELAFKLIEPFIPLKEQRGYHTIIRIRYNKVNSPLLSPAYSKNFLSKLTRYNLSVALVTAV